MSPGRIVLLLLLLGVALLRLPEFVTWFQPPDDAPAGDLTQDWVTAKNVRGGAPPYEPMVEALKRHPDATFKPDGLLAGNAHPPGTIPVVLPFASLSYPDARFAWNAVTFALFVAAVMLFLREIGVQKGPHAVLFGVPLAVVCSPLIFQLALANWNCLLAALLIFAWIADRRGHQWGSGALVGFAAALKLFPLFLAVYFVAARRWKALAGMVLAFVLWNGVALAVVGVEPFRVYARDIAPAVSRDNESSWMNVSATGFWMRLFGPTESHHIEPLAWSPTTGRILSLASQLLIAALVFWVSTKRADPLERDRGFAVATAGMLLASPISWPSSFLLLVVPVGLLFNRLPAGWPRAVLWVAAVVVWLPPNYAAQLALGPEQANAMLTDKHSPLTAAQNLAVASVGVYAAVAFFALALRLPRTPRDDRPWAL
jgi:alpha-1,2-mannosyltransferase